MTRKQFNFHLRMETLENRTVLSTVPVLGDVTAVETAQCRNTTGESTAFGATAHPSDENVFESDDSVETSANRKREPRREANPAGKEVRGLVPYPGFQGGVRVASGDVNGDGTPDIITAPGPGGGPHVRVFDGATGRIGLDFFAYETSFTGGVFVAAGDVNCDGAADIITGRGAGGGPHVRVFDGATGNPIAGFDAYGSTFTGGVRVAAGDVNGDGVADIITGTGPGTPPQVKVFDGSTRTAEEMGYSFPYMSYAPAFTGGVFVAAGDVNGDGRADIITGAGAGGGPHVQVFEVKPDGLVRIRSFDAFDSSFTGGVRVAVGDVNGDGIADIITGAGAGGGPHVKVFDVATETTMIRSYFAYGRSFTGGVFVSAADINGDGLADIITGPGPGGGPHVRVFDVALPRFVIRGIS